MVAYNKLFSNRVTQSVFGLEIRSPHFYARLSQSSGRTKKIELRIYNLLTGLLGPYKELLNGVRLV